MPPRSRSRRPQGQQEEPQWQPVQWPTYREQQRLQAAVEPAELAAAQQRCQALLERGYGAVQDWLLSDPTPAERSRMKPPGRPGGGGQQELALADVFDQESASSTPQAG